MFNSLVIDYMTKVIHWKSDMTHSDVHGRIDKSPLTDGFQSDMDMWNP